MDKKEMKKEINRLKEYSYHIDQEKVRRIFNLIADELYSLKEKLNYLF